MKNHIGKFLLTLLCLVTIPVMAATLIIDADKQAYDYKTNTVNFSGNVKVKMDNINVTSPNAKAKVGKTGQISSAVFTDGAHAVQDNITSQNEIKATVINMSLIKKQVNAKGNVVSVVNESNKPSVTIKSDVQDFDVKTNLMVAQGNVFIDYKDIKTSSQKAEITMDADGNLQKLKLTGNSNVIRGTHSIKADEFVFIPATNNMTAMGHTCSKTMLDGGELLKVYADYQTYDKVKDSLITTGNVKVLYKGYIATGSKAIFSSGSKNIKRLNKVNFIGRAKIKEFNREIEADKIEMTLNPKGFDAQGNVRSWFSNVDSFKKK